MTNTPLPRVTAADLQCGLQELGLRPGDCAFVHSSLRSFGQVEGGAPTVVQALLDVLGVQGTLAAPIFRRFFWEGPDQVWDREHSPSLMGAVSEAVRTWPGSRRSRHAPHPIAALGHHAEALAGCANRSDYAYDSPFSMLIEQDAWVVLLGVDWNVCTLIHLLEERVEVPYRYWASLEGTVVVDGVATRESFPFMLRHEGVHNDFFPLGALLEGEGLVPRVRTGGAVVKAVRARHLYDTGLRALRRDPLLLVSAPTRQEAARHLPSVGGWLSALGAEPGRLVEPVHPVAQHLARVLHVRRASAAPQVEVCSRRLSDDGLVLEELRLRGGPSPVVPALLALPAQAKGPVPAVLCLHGTGGSWERMMERACVPQHSHLLGWARQLARSGFAVLAVTQLSHPPRPEPWEWEWPKLLLPYSQSAMGLLVGDAVFGVEYLCSRPEIDAARIAVAGFSLGGIAAFYAMTVDPRLAAAAVFCGGVGSLEQLVRSGQTGFHSVYFYPPGLLSQGLDHPALAPALAPRPLMVCAATEDPGMPMAGVQAFAAAARQAYSASQADGRFHLLVEEGGHAMTLAALQAATTWLQQMLRPASAGALLAGARVQ